MPPSLRSPKATEVTLVIFLANHFLWVLNHSMCYPVEPQTGCHSLVSDVAVCARGLTLLQPLPHALSAMTSGLRASGPQAKTGRRTPAP